MPRRAAEKLKEKEQVGTEDHISPYLQKLDRDDVVPELLFLGLVEVIPFFTVEPCVAVPRVDRDLTVDEHEDGLEALFAIHHGIDRLSGNAGEMVNLMSAEAWIEWVVLEDRPSGSGAGFLRWRERVKRSVGT